MRVVIITESYLPEVNGVANSVARIAGHLTARGHAVLVIAPRPVSLVDSADPHPVVRLRSIPMPGYSTVRLALPTRRLGRILAAFRPDVVHLASPFVLGAWGAKAAAELGLPIVAIYQTDVPGYARAYRLGLTEVVSWKVIQRLHARATMTLAPSTSTAAQLVEHGVPRVGMWGRGVDTALFHPGRRDDELRRSLAPNDEVLVGYVGRLAREKQVELLEDAAKLPGVQLVVVGDGPMRGAVQRRLGNARFLGPRRGAELARLYASLDVFVHTGPYETFCQTVQEAMASGVPVVAPAVGGPVDLVKPGQTGILVPPGDAAAFARAIAELAADERMRKEYGVAAFDAVASRTWSALGDELIGHYRAAVGAA
ncbi:GDP-mannose-dependent alpha-mannosyltransferase [Rhizocola hellebori]|uniref:GDP-mannose-dependent alpha-mannosyltransferase n=1 Tax=Rhizocola hellebori TaxID=1392758 RepID=A0A8J3QCW8_9ACTN|nr:glycosyltransferase family 1 protein [Rhizocola hellebori]GIH08583.1 GDP-mannose-dependent alpha-mannosyltransferase [Rhizocola hellebori]